MRGITLLVALVVLLSWTIGNVAYAQDAFGSVRLVEEDVRIPAPNANYTIFAKVLKPEGAGPFGAIVLNHGAPVSADSRANVAHSS